MGNGYERFGGRVGRTFGESEAWWPPRHTASPGAPNVIVVLLDDLGYSDFGPFGSEIDTPTLDGLAERGVRLTNYHTAPVCSPARAALMTGLNPHRAGFATVASQDIGFPGYAMEIAEDVLTLPEVLREAGYATFAVGKWHLTRDGAMNDAAVRRSWPVQRGFDRYYGCMEGLQQLLSAESHHGRQQSAGGRSVPAGLLPDRRSDRPRHRDDQEFAGARQSQAILPVLRPPRGARPARRASPDIAKYRGRYAAGWDALREERFARQLEPDCSRRAPDWRPATPSLDSRCQPGRTSRSRSASCSSATRRCTRR